MKRFSIYALLLILLFSLAACDKRDNTDDSVTMLPIDMVLVGGGTFTMGHTVGADSTAQESPAHQVTVSSFYMSHYEVTQHQWKEIMGTNPSYFSGGNHPVERVYWIDCVRFCNLLSQSEDLDPCYSYDGSTDPSDWPANASINLTRVSCDFDGNGYRLPTEAEWEFAARGGSTTPDYLYSGSDIADSVAWYNCGKTYSVAMKQANGLGLYDLSGNVYEFCWDWYANYSDDTETDPTGPSVGTYKAIRGGSWYSTASTCRTSYRTGMVPTTAAYYVGFRICQSATSSN